MKVLAVIAALCCLTPGAVVGQVVMVQQRQGCLVGQCKVFAGSGVIVGRKVTPQHDYEYLVLTVPHNAGISTRRPFVPGASYGLSVVTSAGNAPATVVRVDERRFLMLITFRGAIRDEMQVMRIANAAPAAGSPVVIHGFSHTRSGQYGTRSLTLRTFGDDEFTTTSAFEQGESGGPVVNSGSEIIGLCEGYNVRKIGFGPSVVAIRRFLGLPGLGAAVGSSGPGRPGPVSQGIGVSVSGGGMPGGPVSVPPPPIPADGHAGNEVAGGDARPFIPPVHNPGTVRPVDPPVDVDPEPIRPTPDPISSPIADGSDPIPAIPIPKAGAGTGADTTSRNQPETGAAAVDRPKTGLNLWDVLGVAGAIAGVTVGTGGIGTVGYLAAKGLGAVLAARRARRAVPEQRPPPIQQPIAQQPAPIVPVANPVPPRRPFVIPSPGPHGR